MSTTRRKKAAAKRRVVRGLHKIGAPKRAARHMWDWLVNRWLLDGSPGRAPWLTARRPK